MDEQQIKDLIAEIVSETMKSTLEAHSKALLDDVSKYVDERSEALEAYITTPNQLKAVETVETADTESPLAKRLAMLESELAQEKQAKSDRERQNSLLSFKAAITDELGKVSGIQHSSVVQELLYNRLVDGHEVKDNAILTKSGKTLNEEVGGFLATPEGQHFIKPAQVIGTVGTKQPQAVTRSEAAKSLAQALLG
jgi:dGTP triphosphohydrolase